jgi:prevent-host-death family protein
MDTLLISEFKARCIEVINSVNESGKEVLVTRRGKPLARIVPARQAEAPPRLLGALAGEAEELGDLVQTDLSGDWESLR